MKNLFLIIVLLSTAYLTAVGQPFFSSRACAHVGEAAESDNVVTEKFSIYYRLDKTEVDPTYLDNPSQIEHIVNYLHNSPRIDSITIFSWASPEGTYRHNKWLSEERAKSARRFLLDNTPDSTRLNSEKIKISPIAENWIGLTELVEQNYSRADRDEVLRILTDDRIGDETRKWRLKRLDGGRTWKYLLDNYMPSLRAATWVCVWVPIDVLEKPEIAISDTLVAAFKPLVLDAPAVSKPVLKEKVMIMAARTNLLIPAMNVGLEFPIKNNWSVGVDYFYPWFVSGENKWCTEMLGLFVDGKYWFTGEKYKWTKTEKLQGHAVGVYAGLGYYDFQKIDRGAQGEYVDVGVDYTFGLPIAKGRLRMEFNIGIGWLLTYYRSYSPSSDYEDLIKDPGIVQRSTSFFGPTRASVSFVVPIRVNKRIKY